MKSYPNTPSFGRLTHPRETRTKETLNRNEWIHTPHNCHPAAGSRTLPGAIHTPANAAAETSRFWKTRPKSQPPQANQRPQTREPDPELTKRIQETRDADQAQYLANIATQAETARNRADRNYRQYRAWRGDRHHGIQSTNNDKPAPKAPDCTSCRDTKSIIRGYDGRKIRCPRCR